MAKRKIKLAPTTIDEVIDREQWTLGKQMAAAVACLNAPFCDGGPGERKEWCEAISAVVARDCGGIMALQDAISVLEDAIRLHPNYTNPDNSMKNHPLRKLLLKEAK